MELESKLFVKTNIYAIHSTTWFAQIFLKVSKCHIPRHYYNMQGYDNIIFNANPGRDYTVIGRLNIPEFYMQALKAWHDVKDNKTKADSSVDALTIRQGIIWANKNIVYRGKQLWFNNWIKSKILYVEDLFDGEGNFSTNQLYQKLIHKQNWIAEMQILKKAIPADWFNVLKSNGKWHTQSSEKQSTII